MSGLFGLGSASAPTEGAGVPGLSVESMFAQIMGAVQKSVRNNIVLQDRRLYPEWKPTCVV